MSPTPVPTRITIDFRPSVHPSRAWILGVGDEPARVELLAFDHPIDAAGAIEPLRALSAASAACTCPEFCELDHANE
jgi:hypothetical protein